MEELIISFISHQATWLVIVIAGFSLFTLGKGADLIVDEAVSISKRLGISKAVIGATIVSIGTTLPEASVSVLAAIKGNPDLALGNAVGSIIVDTGLIIGIAALVSPIAIDYKSIRVQSWIQIFAALFIVVLSLPFISNGVIHQWMGMLLVILLIVYIFWSLKLSKKENSKKKLSEGDGSLENLKNQNYMLQIGLLAFGTLLVIMSSKILIPSVEVIAIRIGIPQSIIAATLVAFGTSLPELTTAIKSVLKGHGDLAVGNIIGADILNVLFVIGSAAAVTSEGLKVPSEFYKLQYPFMILVLVIFRITTLSKDQKINRREAFLLLGVYSTYLLLNYL